MKYDGRNTIRRCPCCGSFMPKDAEFCSKACEMKGQKTLGDEYGQTPEN